MFFMPFLPARRLRISHPPLTDIDHHASNLQNAFGISQKPITLHGLITG